jgi:hypothetical protein
MPDERRRGGADAHIVTRRMSVLDDHGMQVVEDLSRVLVEVPPWVTARAVPPVRVLRAADLLDITFRFIGLRLDDGDAGRVLRRAGTKAGKLLAVFPPQHLADQAFYEQASTGDAHADDTQRRLPKDPNEREPEPPTSTEALPRHAVRALLSGRSVLAFTVRDEVIPYTVAGLLDAMRTLAPAVGANAAPDTRRNGPKLGALGAILGHGALEAIATSGVASIGGRRGRAARFDLGDVEVVARARRQTTVLAHRFGAEAALDAAFGHPLAEQLGVTRPPMVEAVPTRPRILPSPADPHESDLTGIELPFRLVLSPHAETRWNHTTADVVPDGRAVLWHTRLAAPGTEPGSLDELADGRTVRAVWARDRTIDAAPITDDNPFGLPDVFGHEDRPKIRLSLNANDRLSIVHQTSDWTNHQTIGRRAVRWIPPAVPVRRLALSTLGGWLDGGVEWATQPDRLELEEWRHLATIGRDHYVRVVRAGYLFPYGHRASLVKVTERRFTPEEPGNPAFLYQRYFIVVRERSRKIPSFGKAELDRQEPFDTIHMTTVVTPPLAAPTTDPAVAGKGVTCFTPMLGGEPFPFKAVAVDRYGNSVELSTPVLFVGKSANDESDIVVDIVEAYKASGKESTFAADARGQRLAFAPSVTPGDTELAVTGLVFQGRTTKALQQGAGPKFGPILSSADVAVPVVDQLLGSGGSTTVEFAGPYVAHGMPAKDEAAHANLAQVFLKPTTSVALDFAGKGDRSGGLVTPSLAISGLSRALGPISGPIDDLASGQMDPSDFFAGITANLFGIVPLTDLIDPGALLAQAPKFLTETIETVAGLVRDAKAFLDAMQDVPSQLEAALINQLNAVKAHVQDLADRIEDLLKTNPTMPTTPAELAAALDQIVGAVKEIEELAVSSGHEDLARPLVAPLQRIRALVADANGAISDVLTLVDEILAFVDGFEIPSTVRTTMSWSPGLKSWPETDGALPKRIVCFDDEATALKLSADIVAPTNGAPPVVDLSCSLTGVQLNLVGEANPFVSINIEQIRFFVRAGRKPDVEVRLADPDGVVFKGPLEFVNTLRDLIPFDGFSDPPSVDVGPEGLTAGFSLALPSLAIGVFSLENVSLAASLQVPFIDESLAFRFAFCTKENPFRLTVSLFGGGGYFGMELTPRGVRLIEAALEFGACVSLDFVVASGSVSVMGGIYFRWEEDKGVSLTGYVRIRGEVDVLGLISASIEMSLELTYQESNQAAGRATIKVEVDVLFFSGSVSISCEKRFAGSNADPTLEESLPELQPGNPSGDTSWTDYCTAFAGV